jgi:pyruvate, water dikinase
MNRILSGCILWIICLAATGQTIYTGRVVDLVTRHPVPGAEIRIKGFQDEVLTDDFGEFRINTGNDSLPTSIISIRGNTVNWTLSSSAVMSIYNISGQLIQTLKMHIGEGTTYLENLNPGIYIIHSSLANGKSLNSKFFYGSINSGTSIVLENSVRRNIMKKYSGADTLLINKAGYFSQEYIIKDTYWEYELMSEGTNGSTDYLTSLIRPESFKLMEGPPLNPIFSEIKTVKVVYSISNNSIYYINSTKYFIHYEFARDILGYNKGHYMFNQEQYTNNPNRKYILASLNFFTASGIYTLDFFSGDELDCDQIKTIYDKVVQTSYFGPEIKFFSNSMKWSGCTSIPSISAEDLFDGQNYQPLNPAETFGYLKKFTLDDLKTQYAGRHDIALLNGIPNDISIVAGIITTEFQTPLSHINVLSHNRGAPNMALRDGWTNPQLEALSNKLVYLKVTLDTFELREASLAEAQAFWNIKDPSEEVTMHCDTITRGLFNLAESNIGSSTVIGGKAANFAELMKINVSGLGPLPLPENAFAIPFYYYWQHMHSHKLDVLVRKILQEPLFHSDFQYRKQQLGKLQDSIRKYPVDPELLALVNAKINESGSFSNIRFRSSTNSEDIKGFNGAGLYDSFTGIPGDPQKTIENAIRKVWASLWNLPAFEEREYFKIDQMSVSMAVLVHRSFPEEAANGVVITKNLYNIYNPGYTINAQDGELSITNPEGGFTPDQIILYTFEDIIEYINHSTAPGMENRTVLSEAEIFKLGAYCSAIQNHYCDLYKECLPLDIEFKVDWVNGVRKLYIKQARLY